MAASRRIDHKRPLPSFETPRKRAAPQDEGDDVAPLSQEATGSIPKPKR